MLVVYLCECFTDSENKEVELTLALSSYIPDTVRKITQQEGSIPLEVYISSEKHLSLQTGFLANVPLLNRCRNRWNCLGKKEKGECWRSRVACEYTFRRTTKYLLLRRLLFFCDGCTDVKRYHLELAKVWWRDFFFNYCEWSNPFVKVCKSDWALSTYRYWSKRQGCINVGEVRAPDLEMD